MAATGYGRSRSKTRDDGYGGNDPESDGEWRRQNSELVLEAEENGVDSSVEMLRSMTRRGNVHVQNFNQVVSLLVSKKRFEDAFRLALEAGQRGMVNTLTFRPLMKNCCANGNGHSAKRVWKAMTEFGVEGDMFLYAELMGALVRSQDMGTAHHVIELLQKSGRRPHVVLYNTLLKGYAKRADVKGGFEVLRTIEDVGIKPDETVCLYFLPFLPAYAVERVECTYVLFLPLSSLRAYCLDFQHST